MTLGRLLELAALPDRYSAVINGSSGLAARSTLKSVLTGPVPGVSVPSMFTSIPDENTPKTSAQQMPLNLKPHRAVPGRQLMRVATNADTRLAISSQTTLW